MSGADVVPSGEVETGSRHADFFDIGGSCILNPDDVTNCVREYCNENQVSPDKLELENLYWTEEGYSAAAIFRHTRDQKHRYIAVEPHLSDEELSILEMLKEKVPNAISFDKGPISPSKEDREQEVRRVSKTLLQRLGYRDSSSGLINKAISSALRSGASEDITLDKEQVRRLNYYLIRDFCDYGKIDPLTRDERVEDISCDGPDVPIFLDHSNYDAVVTNISFGEEELEQTVRKLAGKAGKGISKRSPEVNARLPNGSRARLNLGTEITEQSSPFTIRQFTEVPFTPVDLVTWRTFSLEQMAYVWLLIENEKNGIVAGGTSSGKTTTMNAISLFMPSSHKVVTIEDTPELKLPQANWVSHTTRESFNDRSGSNEFSMYRLLRAAVRENPEYIIAGEIRGREDKPEGQALFQAMSTGHSTFSTFHADSPQRLYNRFSADPINVAREQFISLDFIINQERTTVGGDQVRRAEQITEILGLESDVEDNFDIATTTVYERDPSDDIIKQRKQSRILQDIKRDNNWREEDLQFELKARQIVLAYLVHQEINSYEAVAATIQAYMAEPERVLSLIATEDLEKEIEHMLGSEFINIDVSTAQEARVPRPTLDEDSEYRQDLGRFLKDHKDILQRFSDLDVDFGGDSDGFNFDIVTSSPGSNPVNDPPLGVSAVGLDGEGWADPSQLMAGSPSGEQKVSTDDLEPHHGLARGEFEIEDGEIRQEIEASEEEFDDLYDDDSSELQDQESVDTEGLNPEDIIESESNDGGSHAIVAPTEESDTELAPVEGAGGSPHEANGESREDGASAIEDNGGDANGAESTIFDDVPEGNGSEEGVTQDASIFSKDEADVSLFGDDDAETPDDESADGDVSEDGEGDQDILSDDLPSRGEEQSAAPADSDESEDGSAEPTGGQVGSGESSGGD